MDKIEALDAKKSTRENPAQYKKIRGVGLQPKAAK
jgi:hypothetical protein